MMNKLIEKISTLKDNIIFRSIAVVIAIIAMSPTSMLASHIVGGEITYDCIGDNRYRVFLTVYRDCDNANPLALFDSPAYVGFFDGAGQNLITSVGNGGMRAVYHSPDDTLTTTITSECFIMGQEVCVHTTTYNFVITLPYRPDGYTIAYQRCCRNGTISNIVDPLNTGVTFSTRLLPAAMLACSDSPSFNEWPPVYICVNEDVDYDHSADANPQDELVYSLVTPSLGATRADPYPAILAPPLDDPITWQAPFSENDMLGNPGDPLTIDPQTGRLTGTPTIIGQFLVGVKVDQYRNGVLLSTSTRDFQYNVRQCGEQTTAAFSAPDAVCDSTTVAFVNESDNALNYEWFFNFPDTSDSFKSTEENPTFTFPDTGVYLVALVAYKDLACVDTAFQEIRITTTTVEADFEVDREDCEVSDLVRLIDLSTDSVNTIVEWDWLVVIDGEELGFTEQNPEFNLTNFGTGEITLTVTASNGCSSTLTKEVEFIDLFDNEIDTLHEICRGDTIELNPNFNPDLVYVWSPSDSLENPNSPNPIIFPSDTIIYSVTISDTLTGCSITIDSILVNVRPLPEVVPDTASTMSCVDTILLRLNVDITAGYLFSWEPEENVIEGGDGPTPLVAVQYGVDSLFTYTVTDTVTGCQNIGDIEVQFIDLVFPDVTAEDAETESCVDTMLLELVVHDTSALYIYTWEPAEHIIEGGDGPNPLVRVEAGIDTAFIYTVRDSLTGCITTDTIFVDFINLEYPDLSYLTEIDALCEDTLMLEVINNDPDMVLLWEWLSLDLENGTIIAMGDTSTPLVNILGDPAFFSFTATNLKGCSVTDTIQVNVNQDSLNLDFEYVLDCDTGETIFYSTGNGGPLEWDFGHEGNTAIGDTVRYTYPETGVYEVTLKSTGLCQDSIVREIPIWIFDFETEFEQVKCDGPGEIILNPDGDSTLIYVWDYFPPDTIYNPTVFVESDSTFVATVMDPDSLNCRTTITIDVIVSPVIELVTTPDMEICGDGSDVTLTATSNNDDDIYTWYEDGDSIAVGSTIIVNPRDSTTIMVIATDINMCRDTSFITIDVRDIEIRIEDPQDIYCMNDTLNLVLIAEEPNLISSITWFPESNIVSGQGEEVATVTVMNNQQATFSVTVVYTDGCTKDTSITIDVSIFDPAVMATANPDSIIQGESTDLMTAFNPDYTYIWSPADYIEDGMETTYNPTATPPQDTTFTVTITNADGCTASASVFVRVIVPRCEEPYIFIPTAFSPNGDDSNDVFRIRGEYIDNLEMMIYDRWGKEVFTTRNLNNGWDGRVNGKAVTPDVYGYYVRIECLGGEEITRQGNVTILK